MMNHENDLRYAEKAYLVVDRVAELDGKKSQTFVMEDGTSNVSDEAEDVTNAIICLANFGLASFGDDQVSMLFQGTTMSSWPICRTWQKLIYPRS